MSAYRAGPASTMRTKPYWLPAVNASGCSRSGCSRYGVEVRANAEVNALAAADIVRESVGKGANRGCVTRPRNEPP